VHRIIQDDLGRSLTGSLGMVLVVGRIGLGGQGRGRVSNRSYYVGLCRKISHKVILHCVACQFLSTERGQMKWDLMEAPKKSWSSAELDLRAEKDSNVEHGV
jgi:hypothetical protein